MTDFGRLNDDSEFMGGLVNDEDIRQETQQPSLEPSVRPQLDFSGLADQNFLKTLEDGKDPRLNMAVDQGVRQNPDQYANAAKLSKKTGIPTPAVLDDTAEAEAKARFDSFDLDLLQQQNPATSAFMSVYDNAAQAHDDVDTLKGIEDWFTGITDNLGTTIGLSLKKAGLGMLLGHEDTAAERTSELVPASALPIGLQDLAPQISEDIAQQIGINDEQLQQMKQESVTQLIGDIKAIDEQIGDLTPEDLSVVQEGIRAGIQSFSENAPLMLAMFAGRGTGTTAMLGSAGLRTFGDSYGSARSEGLDPSTSFRYGAIDGSIEVLTELLPTQTLENIFKPVVKGAFSKDLLQFTLRDIGGEQAATLLQSINAYVHDLDQELEGATLEEAIQIQARRQAVTVVATVVGGGGQVAVATGLNKAATMLDNKVNDTEVKTGAEQKRIDKLIELSGDSKLRERNSDTLKQFVEQASTEDDVVHLDATAVQQYLQDNEIDPTQDPAFASVVEQIADAASLGADVIMPVADFVADMASSDHAAVLRPHMRLSSDTMTPAEMDDKQVEQQRVFVEKMLEEAQVEVDTHAEAQEIYQEVRGQLEATGTLDKKAAKLSAQIIPAYVARIATENDISVREAFDQMGLTIVGPHTEQIADQNQREAALVLEQKSQRLQQAEQLGFDTAQIFYHGTSDNISAFNPELTQSRDSGFIGTGVYVTSAPRVADFYANTATPLTRDTDGDFAGPNVMPLVLRTENTKQFTLQEKQEMAQQARQDPEFSQRLTDELQTQGFDSAEVIDGQGDIVERVIFDPAKIRSVNATFDAAATDSADLLAQDEIPTPEQLAARDQNIQQLQDNPESLTEDYENGYDRVIAEAPIIDPQDLIGKTIIPTLADLTDAGRQFTGIDSSQIAEPIELQGGPKFPLLESYQNGEVVWAVNDKGGLTNLQKADYVVVSAMSADTHRSNATVVQSLLSNLDAYVRDGRISDENMQRLDELIRHGNKQIEGMKSIGYPEGADATTVKKWLQSKKTRAQHKKIPTAVRNAIGKKTGFAKYKDGERMTVAEWDNMTDIVMEVMSDRTFANFPGLENADAYHQWAEDLTFVDRAAFTDILVSKEAQLLGVPNFTRILRETVDKDYAGYNFGDAILVIEVDKGSDARIELGTDGTKKHRSYKYGVKGNVVGRFARPINWRSLYPEFAAGQREGGTAANQNRSFQLALPQQEITPEIAGQIASEPFQAIQSPRQATLALNFKNGNWKDSSVAKNKGGVSITDFTDALRASDSAATLTLYDTKDVTKGVRAGNTNVYQLGESEVYFALKRGYNYAEEYGVDLDAAGLTDNETAVVGVINNEPGAKGVAGPAVMLKAIEEGATVLDAFAVRSEKFPDGFLPTLYGEFGFDAVATVPFDPQYFTEQHIEDLKKVWTEAGWSDTEGFPDVVVMKWRGTDEQRDNATTKWIESVTTSGESTTAGQPESSSIELADTWTGASDRQARERERDTGDGSGSVRAGDRAPLASRLGRVLSELEGLSDAERVNLGLAPTSPQLEQSVLAQSQEQARGYFDPNTVTIRMTESSDLSTFLHEAAHFFLEMEWKFGTERVESINNWWKGNADAVARDANSALVKRRITQAGTDSVKVGEADVIEWVDNGTTGDRNKDVAIRIGVHEQFARGFETYLMEGKAPSLELRDAFRAFARWLTNIYRRIRGDLDVKLDNEIRQVFDRMLATDEQIARAEADQRYRPLFNDAAMAGMTDEEFEQYQKRNEKAQDKATETLRGKMLKELTRQTKAWWKDELRDRAQVIEDELKDKQVYKAITALRNKDGGLKMDRAQVKELLGVDKIPPSLRGMTVTGAEGATPDDVAVFLGYGSGDQMLKDIMEAKPVKTAATEQAEAEMKQQHGDILNDGTLNKLADDAVHNEQRGQLILREMKVLARGTSRPAVDRQVIKGLAREHIGKMALKDIRPDKFRRAEIKAAVQAQQAMDSGDKQAALAAKTRQAMNFYLWREATDAQNMAQKITKNASRYRRKTIRTLLAKAGNGYLNQIDSILSRFQFTNNPSLRKLQEQRGTIQSWAEERAKEGDNIQLTNEVLNEGFRAHYREVPFDILVGVHESMKNIEHVARFANKVNLREEQITFAELKAKMIDHWNNLPDKFNATRPDVVETSAGDRFRWAISQMTKIPFLASWLDGGKRAGLTHDVMIQPMTDAANAEQALWSEVGQEIMDAIKGRSKEDAKRHSKRLYIPELDAAKKNGIIPRMMGEPENYHLAGHQVLAVALNTGNRSNLVKMLKGEGWVAADAEDVDMTVDNPYLQAILRHMTKSDWDLVQLIWDKIDALYEPMAKVHKQSSGLDLPKVEATPVETSFGTYAGGYYPLKYDPNRSKRASDLEQAENEMVNTMFAEGGFIRPNANTGAKETRTSFFAPIRFDLNVVPNHVQEVIHYITHFDAVRRTYKLVNDPEIAQAMKGKIGKDEYNQLTPWLNDIAKDGKEAPTKTYFDAWFQRLRFGTTLGMMGFKASTGLIQISGLSNTVAEVGTRYTARALRHIMGSPTTMSNAWRFASENSKVMNHRANTMDRELKNALQQIQGKSGIKAAVQNASMKHIALIQTYMVDLPTWYAAYYKGIDEARVELDADNYDSMSEFEKAIDGHAVRRADWTVENIQGAGMTKDLPAIMRNQAESTRMFTMFMTFFSALWNMERDLTRGARSGQYSPTTVAAKAMFLFAVPVAFEMFMRGDLEDDDEKTAWEKYLANLALYPFLAVPVLRDVVSVPLSDFEHQMSPIGGIMKSGLTGLEKVTEGALTDEDISASQLKGASKLLGAWYGIPGVSQVWSTGEHLQQVMSEGEDLTFRELAFGPERE